MADSQPLKTEASKEDSHSLSQEEFPQDSKHTVAFSPGTQSGTAAESDHKVPTHHFDAEAQIQGPPRRRSRKSVANIQVPTKAPGALTRFQCYLLLGFIIVLVGAALGGALGGVYSRRTASASES